MGDELIEPTGDLALHFQAIEADPYELTAYGVLADRLEELGHAHLPHAYRWCMARGVCPHLREHYVERRGVTYGATRRVPQRFRWAWYSPMMAGRASRILPASEGVRHALPPLLMTGDQRVFGRHAAAMGYLSGRLRELARLHALDPNKGGL